MPERKHFILRGFAYALALASAFAILVVLLHIAVSGYDLLISGHLFSAKRLVENILDGFVLIELFRSFVDYIDYEKLHISLLLETGLVFVLREMASNLYLGHIHFTTMLGYSALILALLLARKLACLEDCA
ncbi:phosphate-starvation-inducible PsiE family protein [Acidithiobacillus sp. M4-SHS-6]|uniref:phosphate-starvation-inducible PsiE family protein n=1 Tax=Acidithiobacillus sp. M4-SHS-6 TaxID=3383024 RepID=UPI0039BDC34A